MKNYLLFISLLFTCLFSLVSEAQLEFTGTGSGRGAVLFSTSGWGEEIRNSGTTNSQPFRVRVWASTDNGYVDNEVISERDYAGLAPNETIRNSYQFSIPLEGDNRSLQDIVGSIAFFQTCIEVAGATPICSERNRSVIPPDPPRFTATKGTSFDTVDLDFIAETRNSETPFDYIKVNWVDRALDAGPAVSQEVRIEPSEIITLEDGVNQKKYRIPFESTPGVASQFSIQQCYTSIMGSFDCGAPGLVSTELGYRTAEATSTKGDLNDRIRLEWPRFAFSQVINNYVVTRCEVGANTDSCVSTRIPSSGPVEFYEDFSVLRGVRYTYTVDSCVGQNPNTCSTDMYKNVARSADSFIGLVDEFEADDSPAQATLVKRSVSQLRSFHTSTDDDWVLIDLDKKSVVIIETLPFEGVNVDTVISLFSFIDNELVLIDENDDVSAVASFSRIDAPELEAGIYYAKVTHFKLIPDGGTDPIIPAPVINNYRLNITINSLDKVIMGPIINLLLDDE